MGRIFIILGFIVSSVSAQANEGIGLVLLHALTRVEDTSVTYVCGSYKKDTAFSVTYFISTGKAQVYRATNEGHQSCRPITKKDAFFKKHSLVNEEVQKALTIVSGRYADTEAISVEILFPVNHPSIAPTLFQRLMSLLSIDAYANGAVGAGRAEVYIYSYVDQRMEAIDQFVLE